MTKQGKPDWAKDYVDYYDMVKSWGYKVEDSASFGSWQGDEVYLLRDGNRVGLLVIGYGSCSGCDALRAVVPWREDDDWSGVISLAEDLHKEIRWFDSWKDMETYLGDPNSPKDWYSFDKQITEWLTEKIAKRTKKILRKTN